MDTDSGSIRMARSRPMSALLGDLRDDVCKLVGQEAQLAKLEIKENAAKAGRLTAVIAGAAIVALAGFTVFLIGLGSLLAMAFGASSGALAAGQVIIGIIATSAGGMTAYLASQRLPEQTIIPTHAIASLRSSAEKVRDNLS